MSELRDLLEQAERAIGTLPPPQGGLEDLTHRRERRHRLNRVLAGIVALAVVAGGAAVSHTLLRASNHRSPEHPAGRTSPNASLTPAPIPTGRIAQRTIDGDPAQPLDSYWFGVTEDTACLRVQPLAIGPSWTFQDIAHDCVPALGSDVIRTGEARGTVHRDGASEPPTRFNAVYGLVTSAARRIDVVWAGGEISSVAPVRGRFLLVWTGSARPLRAISISTDGKSLGAEDLTGP